MSFNIQCSMLHLVNVTFRNYQTLPWDRWMSILIPPPIIRHCFLAAASMQTVMSCNAFSRVNYNGIQDLIQLSKFSSQTFLVNKICLEIKFLSLKIYVLDFLLESLQCGILWGCERDQVCTCKFSGVGGESWCHKSVWHLSAHCTSLFAYLPPHSYFHPLWIWPIRDKSDYQPVTHNLQRKHDNVSASHVSIPASDQNSQQRVSTLV